MEMDIVKAILALNSKAEVLVKGDDIDTCDIIWLNKTTEIAKADILAKQKELQADYDAKAYQRDRAEAYPTIPNQLDDIYHNGIDALKLTIKTIKDKYPKE